jgi:predicted nicotinamide N-methyase
MSFITDKSKKIASVCADSARLSQVDSSVISQPLDWDCEEQLHDILQQQPLGFDLVIASDVLYSTTLISLFWPVVSALLARGADAKVVVSHPIRAEAIDAQVFEVSKQHGFTWTSVPIKSFIPRDEDIPSSEYVPGNTQRVFVFRRRKEDSG